MNEKDEKYNEKEMQKHDEKSAEEKSYGRTNRSLHSVGALPAGTVLTEENTALLRTEKVLRPGLVPRRRREAYGRRLIHNIPAGDGITEEDFE